MSQSNRVVDEAERPKKSSGDSRKVPTAEVWIDGCRVEAGEARVSVFDRGFLYGDSVFETLRTYHKRPFALSEHIQRLAESARRVWIELPIDSGSLAAEIERGIAECAFEECYVRLMVTRGTGALGLDPKNAISPLRVMIVAPLAPPAARKYEQGISAVTFATSRVGDRTEAAGAKIGNYLVAVLANREAAARGAEEALICDGLGHVVEGATSNVFWVEGRRLLTPPLEAGILPGITRAHVLQVARQSGREVDFRVPTISELLQADELFISSSIREILPVCRLDEQVIGGGVPGAVTLGLLAAFRAHCRSS